MSDTFTFFFPFKGEIYFGQQSSIVMKTPQGLLKLMVLREQML